MVENLMEKILLKSNKYGFVKKDKKTNHLVLCLKNINLQLEEIFVINSFSTLDLFRSYDEFEQALNLVLELDDYFKYTDRILFYNKKNLLMKTINRNDLLKPSLINEIIKYPIRDYGYNYLFIGNSYIKISDLNIKELLISNQIGTFKSLSKKMNINPTTFRTKLSRDSFTYKEWLILENIIKNKKIAENKIF